MSSSRRSGSVSSNSLPPLGVAPGDLLPGRAGLPDAQEPDPVEAHLGQAVELGVRNVVQRRRPAERAGQLRQPDAGVDLVERRVTRRAIGMSRPRSDETGACRGRLDGDASTWPSPFDGAEPAEQHGAAQRAEDRNEAVSDDGRHGRRAGEVAGDDHQADGDVARGRGHGQGLPTRAVGAAASPADAQTGQQEQADPDQPRGRMAASIPYCVATIAPTSASEQDVREKADRFGDATGPSGRRVVESQAQRQGSNWVISRVRTIPR